MCGLIVSCLQSSTDIPGRPVLYWKEASGDWEHVNLGEREMRGKEWREEREPVVGMCSIREE